MNQNKVELTILKNELDQKMNQNKVEILDRMQEILNAKKLAQQAYPEATRPIIEQTTLEAFIDWIFNWEV